MRPVVALVAVGLVAAIGPLSGQTAGPSFEVASVKRNASQSQGFYQFTADRLTVANVPLRMIVALAYDVEPSQVIRGEEWVGQDRYDIVARSSAPFAPPTQWREMLRSLLTERFRLDVRREARPAPVFALMRARADEPLGSRLRRSETTCEELAKASPPSADACGMMAANRLTSTGRMSVRGLPIETLARLLGFEVGRQVHDDTSLTGAFDWDLEFAPQRAPQGDADGPSVFTALQEQLGLKLDSRPGSLDVIVIDHAERPVVD